MGLGAMRAARFLAPRGVGRLRSRRCPPWGHDCLLEGHGCLLDRSSIYRHAHATGLFALRRRNSRAVLERLVERVDEVSVTDVGILRALREYNRLNDEGQWPPEDNDAPPRMWCSQEMSSGLRQWRKSNSMASRSGWLQMPQRRSRQPRPIHHHRPSQPIGRRQNAPFLVIPALPRPTLTILPPVSSACERPQPAVTPAALPAGLSAVEASPPWREVPDATLLESYQDASGCACKTPRRTETGW